MCLPASHPRYARPPGIVRCVECGDKVKEINEGERYLTLPCVGIVCQWCELRYQWGTPRESCAPAPALFTAAPPPKPGTFSNRLDGPADREMAALAAMTLRALLEGPKADA